MEESKKNKKNIIQENIIQVIKNGGVVVFPTDTVYGIGALPQKEPVEKIYKIKKRDFSKKIIALISDKKILKDLVQESCENMSKINKILEKYWPGELTVIFRANKNFTHKFDAQMETIGIRIPKNKLALELIEKAGGILLTTSANISGKSAVSQISDLDLEIQKKSDAVVFDKKNENLTGEPSTIIKYEDGKLTLLRQGNILFKEIEKNFDC